MTPNQVYQVSSKWKYGRNGFAEYFYIGIGIIDCKICRHFGYKKWEVFVKYDRLKKYNKVLDSLWDDAGELSELIETGTFISRFQPEIKSALGIFSWQNITI